MIKRIKRSLVMLLCAAMLLDPLSVLAAETDAAGIGAAETGAGDAGTVLQIPASDESSGTEASSKTEELRELLGAETTDNIDPEAAYDEAAIRSELEEKEAYDKELESGKVDDSEKLSDDHTGDGGEGAAEEAGESGLTEAASSEFSFRIGDTEYNGTLADAVDKASSSSKPVYLVNPGETVYVNETIKIPSDKKVELHLNGAAIVGSDTLGSNCIFKVGSNATLRIFGTESRGVDAQICKGGDGAIIADNESTLDLHNLWINQNKAGWNGGALYLGRKVDCRLKCVCFQDNTAGKDGGAIYVNGNTTNIHMDVDTVFVRNSSGSNGGAIYVDAGKVNLYGPAGGTTLFEGNSANGYGGAIYVDSSSFAATSLHFSENTAKKDGGAVYLNGSDGSLKNCEFVNNRADKNGGGFYSNAKNCSITGAEFTGNKCGSGCNGAGIYVDSRYNLGSGGRIIVRDNTTASGAKSGLFLQKGILTQAYLKASSYEKGSDICIGVSDRKEGTRISYEAGNYDPSVFCCESDGWYVAQDQNSSSKMYRYLILTKNAGTAHDAVFESLSNRSEDKKKSFDTGKTYAAADGHSYPLYYGYASSPNHADEQIDIVNKYFYSDGYFFDDPKTYNPHLATFAMNLAMASADSNVNQHDDYAYKFDNVKSMLAGIGCDEDSIYISPSYTVKPTDSSIGVAIGKKEIRSLEDDAVYTLIPIAIRSYNYEKEWASNMTIDGINTSMDNGEHSGFRDARTKVMSALKDYIAKNDLESSLKAGKVKFLITGFSRGSATANLTGAALVNTYGELSEGYKPNSVFAYCFAVPAGGTDTDDLSLKKNTSAYYCIHNIINKVDLTPMVAPEAMGFKRYGVDHYVPGDSASTVKKVRKNASEANGSYPVTLLYDNNPFYTNSASYAAKRPDMLKQLALVNKDIHFVDYFKESEIVLGVKRALGQTIVGGLSYYESEPVKIKEVSNSTMILEEWLPKFYAQMQSYNTLGADKKLTRRNYSTVEVKAGKQDPARGEKNWYALGSTAQDAFRSLVMLMLSKTPTEKAELGMSLSGMKNKMGGAWDMLWLYENLVDSSSGWDAGEERQQKYLDMFWNMLNDNKYGQKSLRDAITDTAEMAAFEKTFPTIMSIVLRAARQDFKDPEHDGTMRLLGTFANNTEAILQGHVPEIALAWLRINDDYYAGETKAYAWAEESAPGPAAITLKGALTDGINIGECRGDLRCSDEGAEIYYTLTDSHGVTTEPALYQKTAPVIFAEPASGTGVETYTLKAWIYRSYAVSDRKVRWSTYLGQEGQDEKTFTVKVKKDDPKIVTVKCRKGSVTETVKTVSVNNGDKVYISRSDFAEDMPDSQWYFTGFDVDRGSVQSYTQDNISWLVDSDVTVTAVFEPKITAISFYDDYIRDNLCPKTEPVCSVLYPGLLKSKIKLHYADGTSGFYTSGDGYVPLEWYRYENGEPEKVTGKNPKAEPGAKYRVCFGINDRTFRVPLSVSLGQITTAGYEGPEVMTRNDKGEAEGYIEFDLLTGRKEIVTCGADVPEVEVPTVDDLATLRETIRNTLPSSCGFITTNDGISLRGLHVEWACGPGDITAEIPVGEVETILGTISDNGADAVRNHDWSTRKSKSGMDPYTVSANVRVVSDDFLSPPMADPVGGDLDLDPESSLPMDERGNLLVSLKPVVSSSGNRIIYTLRDGDGNVVNSQEDAEYSDPIVLTKPEAGESAVYTISAYRRDGDRRSEAKEWTYTLHNTAEKYTLRVMGEDCDHLSDPRDIEALEDNDFDAVYPASAGDVMHLSAGDITDGRYSDKYRVISWQVISDTGEWSDIPDSDSDLLWYDMPEKDVYMRAVLAPLAESIEIGLDSPRTGSALSTHPYSVVMNIGGESYEIDPDTVDVSWTLSGNNAEVKGIAAAHRGYEAMVFMDTASLNAVMPDEYGEQVSRDFDLHYCVSDRVKYYISSGSEDEKHEISNFYVTEDEKGYATAFMMKRGFAVTGNASFIGIDRPEDITVPWNGVKTDRYENVVKPALPGSLRALADDGSRRTMSIHWLEPDAGDIEALDGPGDGIISLTGYIDIPEDLDYEKDEQGYPVDPAINNGKYGFKYTVALEGAPVSNTPDILPFGGTYDADDDIILDFDTFPRTSSENGVKVYYMITSIPEDRYFMEATPCWYREDWEIEKNPLAHVLSGNGLDIEDRRIVGADYKETGARVTAIAVEDGGYRMSAPVVQDFIFSEQPEAQIPDEVLEALHSLKMRSGSSLQSIEGELPEGCSFDPDEDTGVYLRGNADDTVYVGVVYNPDPGCYRDAHIDACVTFTPGVYGIITENGRAYTTDKDTGDMTEVTEAESGSTVILSADEAPDGKVFDRWAVYSETGEDVSYTGIAGEAGKVSLEMPEGGIYARAVYKDPFGNVPDAVERITLDRSSFDLAKGEEAMITADVTYASGVTLRPDVEFRCDSEILSLKPDGASGVKIRALDSGNAVVWAVCGDSAVCCTVTVGQSRLVYEITGGHLVLSDGTCSAAGTIGRGAVVKLAADEPANDAVKFGGWLIKGAAIDTSKPEVTFTVTDDIMAKAEFTDREEYADAGAYPDTKVKIKSLKLTDVVKGKKLSAVRTGVNGTVEVKAKAVYRGTARPDILFRSSNTDVVKVRTVSTNTGEATGYIVGTQAGTATVTAYCGNKKAVLKVTVEGETVTGVKVVSEKIADETTNDGQFILRLKPGEQEMVKLMPEPFDSTAAMKITWKSDDKKTATVKNGIIKASARGRGATTVKAVVSCRPMGSKKWIKVDTVYITVRVSGPEIPKAQRKDRRYSLSLKKTQALDLDASRIGKRKIVSETAAAVKIKGKAPEVLEWESTNEDIVKVSPTEGNAARADIKAVGTGTAYVTVTGYDEASPDIVNRAVMKVTVTATCPEISITGDSRELLSDDGSTLTLKAGSCDRLYYSVLSDSEVDPVNVSQVPTWSAKGGVTVQDGVIKANKRTKPGRPATVTMKCGKAKTVLRVIVE